MGKKARGAAKENTLNILTRNAHRAHWSKKYLYFIEKIQQRLADGLGTVTVLIVDEMRAVIMGHGQKKCGMPASERGEIKTQRLHQLDP
jgi:hypothetical protein